MDNAASLAGKMPKGSGKNRGEVKNKIYIAPLIEKKIDSLGSQVKPVWTVIVTPIKHKLSRNFSITKFVIQSKIKLCVERSHARTCLTKCERGVYYEFFLRGNALKIKTSD